MEPVDNQWCCDGKGSPCAQINVITNVSNRNRNNNKRRKRIGRQHERDDGYHLSPTIAEVSGQAPQEPAKEQRQYQQPDDAQCGSPQQKEEKQRQLDISQEEEEKEEGASNTSGGKRHTSCDGLPCYFPSHWYTRQFVLLH